ncbi:MAG TPA: TIGR01777 family oxidoreductase [Candidatus Baltobacteraceae bacterium]|nr:TIGR01777 family oxidoreductase [Candidatus Baltobacteraceae bacterium]
MKILISGASGLVGKSLSAALREQGHTVARLVRPGGTVSAGDVSWDPMAATADTAAMEGTDAVVHLSGASIAGGRWTPARKAILRSSRIDTTRVLVDSIANLRKKPAVFVCASATGYYGNRGDEILTESSSAGGDFLALLARDWEAEAARAELSGIRTVMLRFGLVLSKDGGALSRMLLPFRLGLGGRFGSGAQWMPWISLEDAVAIARSAITDAQFTGPWNIVAPNPVRNSEFTKILAAALHRPAIFPVPPFALRLALGDMGEALLLTGQRAVPARLLAAKFSFRFETLDAALQAILAKP